MLKNIKIRNFALLQEASLELKKGLNVITGQTGAGKSILVGALSMVLGERVNRKIVREGTKFCEVEAEYGTIIKDDIKKFLEEKDLGSEELVLRRKFYARGRSRCYINGRYVNVGTLKVLGNILVDIHSQNEHQTLLKKRKQRAILDQFSGTVKQVEKLAGLWEEYIKIKKKKQKRSEEINRINSEIDRLTHEVEEIDSVHLKEGIEEELDKKYNILNNAEFIKKTIEELSASLYENEGALIETLSKVLKKAEDIKEIDEQFTELTKILENTVYKVEAAYEELRTSRFADDFDPRQLKKISDKRDKIIDLKRKFGPDIQDIIKYREELEEKLKKFDNSDKNIREMEIKIKDYQTKMDKIAQKISKKRLQGAEKLAENVEKKLSRLGMENAEFSVELKPKDMGPTGTETVVYFITPNPGEPRRKLTQVASGGEISRIMLAIKSSLAHSDNIPILIFDEIDTGIGATIGKNVGVELKNLAAYHQVITITHLPQIARKAGNHIKVIKKTAADRTRTEIKLLDGENRKKELQRLFGGKIKTA